MSINPDRLIIVLRAVVETMKTLGECCKLKDTEDKQLGFVLVENLVGRNIAQRLIEILKIYKPLTHEPRVLSYAIEALHYCLLLMEEVTEGGAKAEKPREFTVIKYGTAYATEGPRRSTVGCSFRICSCTRGERGGDR